MNETEKLRQVEKLFDEWASSGRARGMAEKHSPTASQAFQRLALEPAQRYLDIGCGDGYTVRWAAEIHESIQAYGLDVSEQMVKLARSLSSEQPNARFIHSPFPLPMLKAKSFDAIFSMEVFYYLPDLSWALLSVGRLLKPGGLFACVVDYYEENTASHNWPDDLSLNMTLLSEAGWRQAMIEVGFEVVEQTRLQAEGAPTLASSNPSAGSLMTLVRRPSAPQAPPETEATIH